MPGHTAVENSVHVNCLNGYKRYKRTLRHTVSMNLPDKYNQLEYFSALQCEHVRPEAFVWDGLRAPLCTRGLQSCVAQLCARTSCGIWPAPGNMTDHI